MLRMELTLTPGVYEYRIVADSEWMPAPLAHETAPNPFVSLNAVLRFPPPARPETGKARRTA